MFLTMLAAAAGPTAMAAAPPVQGAEPAAEQGVIAYPPSFFADGAPTTAYDMVIRLPGFTFDKGESVRGLAGAGGNVLIDGQPPVSKNDALDELLKRIPAGSVQRIELIRGGAPGVAMQGRSVLANVVRSRVDGARGAVMLSSQSIYDGRVLNSLRAETQAQLGGRQFEASLVYGKGPDDSLGDGGRTRYAPDGTVRILSNVDGDGGGLRAWTTGAFETPLAGGRLRLNGAYMRTPSSLEITDRLLVPGGKEYEYVSNLKIQKELGGRFSRRLGERTSLELIAFQQWNDLETGADFEGPGLRRDFDLDKQVRESVGRLTLRRDASAGLALEGGVEGALNRLESETAFTLNGAPVALPAADVEVEEKRSEVFLTATWRGRPGLTAELGLRQENSSISSSGDVTLEKSLAFTKPRLALTWSPAEGRQLRLRLEREVGQLNFDDFVASSSAVNTGVVIAGNPDLSPQQAWVAEAAFEQRFGGGAAVATLRHYELTDVIDRAPLYAGGVAVADAPANIGDGTKDELQLSLTLPLDRFGVKAAQLKTQATRRWSEVTDPVTGAEREISGLRPLEWEAHFTQDLPQWRANWGIDATGGYRESYYRLAEVETKKWETWVVLFAEYKPRSDIVLRLELQNVFERDVQRIREVYAGPRSAGQLAYLDVRDLEYGKMIFVRLRKTFG